jgi:hypothetical protein
MKNNTQKRPQKTIPFGVRHCIMEYYFINVFDIKGPSSKISKIGYAEITNVYFKSSVQ